MAKQSRGEENKGTAKTDTKLNEEKPIISEQVSIQPIKEKKPKKTAIKPVKPFDEQKLLDISQQGETKLSETPNPVKQATDLLNFKPKPIEPLPTVQDFNISPEIEDAITEPSPDIDLQQVANAIPKTMFNQKFKYTGVENYKVQPNTFHVPKMTAPFEVLDEVDHKGLGFYHPLTNEFVINKESVKKAKEWYTQKYDEAIINLDKLDDPRSILEQGAHWFSRFLGETTPIGMNDSEYRKLKFISETYQDKIEELTMLENADRIHKLQGHGGIKMDYKGGMGEGRINNLIPYVMTVFTKPVDALVGLFSDDPNRKKLTTWTEDEEQAFVNRWLEQVKDPDAGQAKEISTEWNDVGFHAFGAGLNLVTDMTKGPFSVAMKGITKVKQIGQVMRAFGKAGNLMYGDRAIAEVDLAEKAMKIYQHTDFEQIKKIKWYNDFGKIIKASLQGKDLSTPLGTMPGFATINGKTVGDILLKHPAEVGFAAALSSIMKGESEPEQIATSAMHMGMISFLSGGASMILGDVARALWMTSRGTQYLKYSPEVAQKAFTGAAKNIQTVSNFVGDTGGFVAFDELNKNLLGSESLYGNFWKDALHNAIMGNFFHVSPVGNAIKGEWKREKGLKLEKDTPKVITQDKELVQEYIQRGRQSIFTTPNELAPDRPVYTIYKSFGEKARDEFGAVTNNKNIYQWGLANGASKEVLDVVKPIMEKNPDQVVYFEDLTGNNANAPAIWDATRQAIVINTKSIYGDVQVKNNGKVYSTQREITARHNWEADRVFSLIAHELNHKEIKDKYETNKEFRAIVDKTLQPILDYFKTERFQEVLEKDGAIAGVIDELNEMPENVYKQELLARMYEANNPLAKHLRFVKEGQEVSLYKKLGTVIASKLWGTTYEGSAFKQAHELAEIADKYDNPIKGLTGWRRLMTKPAYNVEGTAIAGEDMQASIETLKSDNFKNFFGDWENDKENSSKIVNKDGTPKVVYHGTQSPNIESFNTERSRRTGEWSGIYTTANPNYANQYASYNRVAMGKKPFDIEESGPQLYPLYLNIKNPLKMSMATGIPKDLADIIGYSQKGINNTGIVKFIKQVLLTSVYAPIMLLHSTGYLPKIKNTKYGIGAQYYFKSTWEAWKKGISPNDDINSRIYVQMSFLKKEIVDKLKEKGYDGIDYENGLEYVVFDPAQVKSAIGNRGTYDPNDPNILHSSHKLFDPKLDEDIEAEFEKFKRISYLSTPVDLERKDDRATDNGGWHDNYIENFYQKLGLKSEDQFVREIEGKSFEEIKKFITDATVAEGDLTDQKQMVIARKAIQAKNLKIMPAVIMDGNGRFTKYYGATYKNKPISRVQGIPHFRDSFYKQLKKEFFDEGNQYPDLPAEEKLPLELLTNAREAFIVNDRSDVQDALADRQKRNASIDQSLFLIPKNGGFRVYHLKGLDKIAANKETTKKFCSSSNKIQAMRWLDSQSTWGGERPLFGDKTPGQVLSYLNMDNMIRKYVLNDQSVKTEQLSRYKLSDKSIATIDIIGNKIKELYKDLESDKPANVPAYLKKDFNSNQALYDAINGLYSMQFDSGMKSWTMKHKGNEYNVGKYMSKYQSLNLNPHPMMLQDVKELAEFFPNLIREDGTVDKELLQINDLNIDSDNNVYVDQFVWQEAFEKHPLMKDNIIAKRLAKYIHDGGDKVLSDAIWGIFADIQGFDPYTNGFSKQASSSLDMMMKNGSHYANPEPDQTDYFSNWLRKVQTTAPIIAHNTNFKDSYREIKEVPAAFDGENYTLVMTEQGEWLKVYKTGDIKKTADPEALQKETDYVLSALVNDGITYHKVKRYITGDKAVKFISNGGHSSSEGPSLGVHNSPNYHAGDPFFKQTENGELAYQKLNDGVNSLQKRLSNTIIDYQTLHDILGQKKGAEFNQVDLEAGARALEDIKNSLMGEFDKGSSQRSFVYSATPEQVINIINKSISNGRLVPEMLPTLSYVFGGTFTGALRTKAGYNTMIAYKIKDLLDRMDKAGFTGSSVKMYPSGDEGYWALKGIERAGEKEDYLTMEYRTQLYEEHIDPLTGMYKPNSNGCIVPPDMLRKLNESRERQGLPELTIGSKIFLVLTPSSGLESLYGATIIGVGKRHGQLSMNAEHATKILGRDFDADSIGVIADNNDFARGDFDIIHDHWTRAYPYLERQVKIKTDIVPQLMKEEVQGKGSRFNVISGLNFNKRVVSPIQPGYSEGMLDAELGKDKGLGLRNKLGQGLNTLKWTEGEDGHYYAREVIPDNKKENEFIFKRSGKDDYHPVLGAVNKTSLLAGLGVDSYIDGYNFTTIDGTSALMASVIETINGKKWKELTRAEKEKYTDLTKRHFGELLGIKNSIFEMKDLEGYMRYLTSAEVPEGTNSQSANLVHNFRGEFAKRRPQAKTAISEQQVQAETNKPNYISFGEFKKPTNRAEGTPADKAMREVADGFIGEVVNNNSSSQTSRNHLIDKTNKRGVSGFTTDWVQGVNDENAKIIMLARNSEVAKKIKELNQDTKTMIRKANANGAEFIVGNSWIDKPFHDYLNEIGAKYTIYGHEGSNRVQKPNLEPVKPKEQPQIKPLDYPAYAEYQERKLDWQRQQTIRKEFRTRQDEIIEGLSPDIKPVYKQTFDENTGVIADLQKQFFKVNTTKLNKIAKGPELSETEILFPEIKADTPTNKVIASTVMHYLGKWLEPKMTEEMNISGQVDALAPRRLRYSKGKIEEVDLVGEQVFNSIPINKLFDANGNYMAEGWLPIELAISPKIQSKFIYNEKRISDGMIAELKANTASNLAIHLEPQFKDELDRNALFTLIGFNKANIKNLPLTEDLTGKIDGTFLSSLNYYTSDLTGNSARKGNYEQFMKQYGVDKEEAIKVLNAETNDNTLDIVRYAREKGIEPEMLGNLSLDQYLFDLAARQGETLYGKSPIKENPEGTMQAGPQILVDYDKPIKEYVDYADDAGDFVTAVQTSSVLSDKIKNKPLRLINADDYAEIHKAIIKPLLENSGIREDILPEYLKAFSPSAYEAARHAYGNNELALKTFNAAYLARVFKDIREAFKVGKGARLNQYNPFKVSIPGVYVNERSTTKQYYPPDHRYGYDFITVNGEVLRDGMTGETLGTPKQVKDLVELPIHAQNVGGLWAKSFIEVLLPMQDISDTKDRAGGFIRKFMTDSNTGVTRDPVLLRQLVDNFPDVAEYVNERFAFSNRNEATVEKAEVFDKHDKEATSYDPQDKHIAEAIDQIAKTLIASGQMPKYIGSHGENLLKATIKNYILFRSMLGTVKNHARILEQNILFHYGAEPARELTTWLNELDLDNPKALQKALREINFISDDPIQAKGKSELLKMINDAGEEAVNSWREDKSKFGQQAEALGYRVLVGDKYENAMNLAKGILDRSYVDNGEITPEAREEAIDVLKRGYEGFQNDVANVGGLRKHIEALAKEIETAGDITTAEYYGKKYSEAQDNLIAQREENSLNGIEDYSIPTEFSIDSRNYKREAENQTPIKEHLTEKLKWAKEREAKLTEAEREGYHLEDSLPVAMELINDVTKYVSGKHEQSGFYYELLRAAGIDQWQKPWALLQGDEMKMLGRLAKQEVNRIFNEYHSNRKKNKELIDYSKGLGASAQINLEYEPVNVGDKTIYRRGLGDAVALKGQADITDLIDAYYQITGKPQMTNELYNYSLPSLAKKVDEMGIRAAKACESIGIKQHEAMGEKNKFVRDLVTDQLNKVSKYDGTIYNGVQFSGNDLAKKAATNYNGVDIEHTGSPVLLKTWDSYGKEKTLYGTYLGIAKAKVSGMEGMDNADYVLFYKDGKIHAMMPSNINSMTIGNPYGLLDRKVLEQKKKQYKKKAPEILKDFNEKYQLEVTPYKGHTVGIKEMEAARELPNNLRYNIAGQENFIELGANKSPQYFDVYDYTQRNLEGSIKGLRTLEDKTLFGKAYDAIGKLMDFESKVLVGGTYMKLNYLASAGINLALGIGGDPHGLYKAGADLGAYFTGMFVRSKMANELGMAAVLGRQSYYRDEGRHAYNAVAGLRGAWRGIKAGKQQLDALNKKLDLAQLERSVKETQAFAEARELIDLDKAVQDVKNETDPETKLSLYAKAKAKLKLSTANANSTIRADFNQVHHAKANFKAIEGFYKRYDALFNDGGENSEALAKALETYQNGRWNRAAKEKIQLYQIGEDIIPFIDGRTAEYWGEFVKPLTDMALYAASWRGWTQHNELESAQRAYRALFRERNYGITEFKKTLGKKLGYDKLDIENVSISDLFLRNLAANEMDISIGNYNRMPGHKGKLGRQLTMYQAFGKTNMLDQTVFWDTRRKYYRDMVTIMADDKEFVKTMEHIGLPFGEGVLYNPVNEVKNALLPSAAGGLLQLRPAFLAMSVFDDWLDGILRNNDLVDDMFDIFFGHAFKLPIATAVGALGLIELATITADYVSPMSKETATPITGKDARKRINKAVDKTLQAIVTPFVPGYMQNKALDFIGESVMLGMVNEYNKLRSAPNWDRMEPAIKADMMYRAMRNGTSWIPGGEPLGRVYDKLDNPFHADSLLRKPRKRKSRQSGEYDFLDSKQSKEYDFLND